MATYVKKRDGQIVPFDSRKIEVAVAKAWAAVHKEADATKCGAVAAWVLPLLPPDTVDIEAIQDLVEISLMKQDTAVAKAYILYRQRRAELRHVRQHPDPRAVADYIHPSKYARYLPDLQRRETFAETVARVETMHRKRFPALAPEITAAFDLVRTQRVLPSMRSMQFGGSAIEANHLRCYNCAFTLIDRPRAFAEALYLLLCGTGVGFSVQIEHVARLPALAFVDYDRVVHHTIGDSIEGWANALDALVQSYLGGYYLEFNYSQIRDKGVPLKTSGGRAPGHRTLKRSLERIRALLDEAQGRQLRPLEAHDLLCHAADAVLSGGIRRSAMISLFSLEDSELLYAKTGKWHRVAPWRENANNSVMLRRREVKRAQFERVLRMTREWGEPGFYFCESLDYGTNPCAEIGLNPVLVCTDAVLAKIKARGVADVLPAHGTKLTGWQMCNLAELNAAVFKTADDFRQAARAATLLCTLQAAYTTFPYLGWVSELITEQEALIGVGMTGMLDAPAVALDPAVQASVAASIGLWNRDFAHRIGVQPAARTTCVKPSGTTSLELGCVGSGIHAHHAKRYLRRVIAKDTETVFQYFRSINPHMCVRKPNGDWVIEFPVEAPAGAIVKEDLTAVQFLEHVRSTQENWVVPGTARAEISPGLTHSVSNTVHVKPDEWAAVAEYLWTHRDAFAGVSLLAATGDKDYAFSPNEAIVTAADEARWNQLLAAYKPVDYTQLREAEDGTALLSEPACAGGACAL